MLTVSDAPDYEQPWQTHGPQNSTGSGAAMEVELRGEASSAGATPAQRAAAVAELTRHIQRAAQSLLPPGRTLQVEILDLQRAGMYNPAFGTATNVRIQSSVNPPRIVLRYRLGSQGAARTGSATLTDVEYLANPYARSSGDRFIYEKALLDDWLRKIATR